MVNEIYPQVDPLELKKRLEEDLKMELGYDEALIYLGNKVQSVEALAGLGTLDVSIGLQHSDGPTIQGFKFGRSSRRAKGEGTLLRTVEEQVIRRESE